jgi:hypothetical protein
MKKLALSPATLKLLWTFAGVAMIFTLAGQEDTARNEFQKSFDDFLHKSQQEFDAFKSSNDSIFYGFLKESWKEFDLFMDEKPVVPKPVDQPEIKIRKIKSKEIEPVIRKTMLQDSGRQIQFHLAPNNYDEYKPVKQYNTINFYGTRVNVFKIPAFTRWNATVSSESVADFFMAAVNDDDLVYAVYDLYNKATHKKLNNWGYIRLLQDASASLFSSLNERVLFTWTALIKTGYDARIGMNSGNLYLLVNFDVPVYYSQYLIKGNKKYYLVSFDGQQQKNESITSVKADYPAELSPASLRISEIPELGNKSGSRKISYKGKKIDLAYNQNLVDFYEAYPDCELAIYFSQPLSAIALDEIDRFVKPMLAGKSKLEQLSELLQFVQKGMDYDTDNKQFGYENYLFAEEALYYPSIDCEDRTVLLSCLIDHYLGLGTIALGFPGHVTLAVNLDQQIDGSYIKYRNEKYYVCDPTYIGSKPGMLMPEFEDVNPEVITY